MRAGLDDDELDAEALAEADQAEKSKALELLAAKYVFRSALWFDSLAFQEGTRTEKAGDRAERGRRQKGSDEAARRTKRANYRPSEEFCSVESGWPWSLWLLLICFVFSSDKAKDFLKIQESACVSQRRQSS